MRWFGWFRKKEEEPDPRLDELMKAIKSMVKKLEAIEAGLDTLKPAPKPEPKVLRSKRKKLKK